MSIRQLSLKLNLDTSEFSASVRAVDGSVKSLKSNFGSMDGVLRTLSRGMKDVSNVQNEVASSATRLAAGLRSQLGSMDANRQALLLQQAELRGCRGEMETLLEATRELSAGQSQAATVAKEYLEAERATAVAERDRQAAAEGLTNSLREQIVVLRGGTEALTLERAAMLGCEEEVRALLANINQLNIEHKEAEATARAFAEAEREAANAARQEMTAQEQAAAAIRRQIQSMREQIILQKEGTAGLLRYRAETAGVAHAMEEELVAAKALELQIGKLTRAHHGSSGAIVEANRIMHEASRGAFTQMTGSITILLNRLGVAGGLTLALGVTIGVLHAMIAPALEGAKAMEEMAHRAQELGMTLHDMEDMGVLAELAGIKLDKVTAAAGRMDGAFARARMGSKQTAQAFAALGIDITKNFTSKELLDKTAEAFSKMEDGPRKAALAIALFGRSGKEMIPFLTEYAERMKEAGQLADEYGIHNQKATDAGLQLAAATHENKIAMEGLGKVFMEAVGPTLTEVTTGFNELIRQFINSYKRGGEAKSMLDALVFVLKGVITVVVETATTLYAIVKAISAVAWVIQGVAIGAWAGLEYAIGAAIGGIVQFSKIMNDLIHLNWGGALSDSKNFFNEVGRYAEAASKKAMDGAKKSFSNAGGDIGAANRMFQKGDNFVGHLWGKPAKTYKTPNVPKAGDEGTTEGDPFKDPKTKQQHDKANDLLSKLKGDLAGLQGQLTDTGSAWSKYNEEMNDHNSALAKAVAKHPELRAQILATARAIDDAREQLKGKKAYEDLKTEAEKQHEAFEQTKADYAKQVAGADEASRANARYAASLKKNIEESAKWHLGRPAGAKDGATLGAEATADKTGTEDYTRASRALEDLKKQARETGEAASTAWGEYEGGLDQAALAAARLKSQLAELVRLQPTEEGKRQAQTFADQVLANSGRESTLKALASMKAETKKINAELMTDTVEKERAITEEEIKQARERIKWADLTADERKKAEQEFADYAKAKRAETEANTPWGKMQHDWEDAMSNMKDASAGWMSGFVDELAEGKIASADFAMSIIKDLAKIILRAMFAKYVLSAINAAMSGGGGYVDTSGLPANNLEVGAGDINSLPTVGGYHTGGIAGFNPTFTRPVDPSVFANAFRYHIGGTAGLLPGEVPAILRKGEGVFTENQMRNMAGNSGPTAAPPVHINLNNQSGTQLDADHGGTKFDGEKYIVDVVVSRLGRPGVLRNAIKSSQ